MSSYAIFWPPPVAVVVADDFGFFWRLRWEPSAGALGGGRSAGPFDGRLRRQLWGLLLLFFFPAVFVAAAALSFS